MDRLRNLLNVRRSGPGGPASSVYLRPGDTAASSEWRERLARVRGTPEANGCGLVGLRAGDRPLRIARPAAAASSRPHERWNAGARSYLLDRSPRGGVVSRGGGSGKGGGGGTRKAAWDPGQTAENLYLVARCFETRATRLPQHEGKYRNISFLILRKALGGLSRS